MQILLLGASGRTGKLILSTAISHNHTVTALIRNSSSLTPTTKMTVVSGSPLNEQDIEKAIKASPAPPSAIIIALASVRETESPFSKPTSPPRMMTEAHEKALEAMKKFGIKRLITISAFGVGDSNPEVFWPARMVLNHSGIGFAYADHNAVEVLVRKTAEEWENEGGHGKLEWTLVRPVMLNDKEAKDVKVLGNNGKGAGMLPSCSRGSVAAFVVGRCLEGGEFVGGTPVICD